MLWFNFKPDQHNLQLGLGLTPSADVSKIDERVLACYIVVNGRMNILIEYLLVSWRTLVYLRFVLV
jgi:hypothetical protein